MADLPGEIASGDQRRALVAIRDALAQHMMECEPNVVAQIAARLQSVIAAIAAMPVTGRVAVKDDLKARRADRIAAAKTQASPARSGRKRGG